MSWLLVIAQLCQISIATGSGWTTNSDSKQVECQKELIICFKKNRQQNIASDDTIADCVLKRHED